MANNQSDDEIPVGSPPASDRPERSFPVLSGAEAWSRLPSPVRGGGAALPEWARITAGPLPCTTAALLQLDLAHRTVGPVPLPLRSAMRWIAAHSVQCGYGMVHAAADALRHGVSDDLLNALSQDGWPGWSPQDRRALKFARDMTVHSAMVTDEEFALLVQDFGERQTASMVLLLAWANFHDRLMLCLNLRPDPTRPAVPLDVEFPARAFVIRTTPPPPPPPSGHFPAAGVTADAAEDHPDQGRHAYDDLQTRLETQRRKLTRLRIPEWEEISGILPPGLMPRPTDIVWYRIVFGYAPELAVPFELVMRTAGAEAGANWDRIFAGSLFWVTTQAVQCPYCMGHCEMNWEVAGLTSDEIAARSRLLAGHDWTAFPQREQQALEFASKLSQTPWAISDEDVGRLQAGFGIEMALVLIFHACRYHYMTRISNGFQLTLERENVFWDYFNTKPSR